MIALLGLIAALFDSVATPLLVADGGDALFLGLLDDQTRGRRGDVSGFESFFEDGQGVSGAALAGEDTGVGGGGFTIFRCGQQIVRSFIRG